MFRKIKRSIHTIQWLSLTLVVSACASKAFVAPTAIPPALLERSQTQSAGTIAVTAAVPDAAETKAITGLDLYAQDIQPVWLKVSNQGDVRARVSLISVDEEYYSPMEVAWQNRKPYSKEGRQAMERWFYENQMPRRIPPGESRSGYVFTNLTSGTKGFNVDIFTTQDSRNFTFFIRIPGFTADYMEVDFRNLYSQDELLMLDTGGLRQALADLPCCSSDASGNSAGDPFNVAFVSTGLALRRALLRGGWEETAANSPDTALARTHRYRGRQPDGTFHKARPDGSERKELRIWLTPMLVDDVNVWLGQVSYDMYGKTLFSSFADYRIDPDLDDARMFLLQNFWYNQSLEKVGFIARGQPSTLESPKSNFNGNEYFTDDMIPVMFVPASPVALDDTQILEWDKMLNE